MPLAKSYEPKNYESKLYQAWQKAGSFAPAERGEAYCILMPPPNANGDLHLGHALTIALEDVMIRAARMQGKAALYLPGADHAGFETQVVYEKVLEKQGQSRFDFSREELYEQIMEFVQTNRSNMEGQLAALGASCDWDRFTFTLDENVIARTQATFKRLWDEGLLYRGKRIVNYCTHHGTSFSELEVEYQEVKSSLYYLRYPLENGEGEIVVATTRPETMLGDTAVAVAPKDERYRDLVGESVHLPLVGRPIPIVADAAVDAEFGSGAVKVTPAHDPLDFEIGERHSLPFVSVIGHDGHLTDEVPAAYRGLSVLEARKQVVKDLKAAGNLLKQEKYTHSVGHCYKCGTVIEPLVKDQWLINMQPLAKRAIKALDEAKIEVIPRSKTKVLYHWLENIKDWNISRQIAWGIPIPAFQHVDNPEEWIFSTKTDQETITVKGATYHRDPDVFDTWFSSGQWPLATLGYPDSADFQRFYPTSVMETAGEILFFWVARMLMLGLHLTDDVPFQTIYLHGLVLDEKGVKMSKSRGNVISPQELSDRYGSDALRMGLISGRSPGQNQGFAENRVAGMRNFANKLWNVARFALTQVGEEYAPRAPQAKTVGEQWIESRIHQTTATVTADLEKFRFAQAQEKLYDLLWNDFADWYVELSKHEPNPDLLIWGLETILKLTHPFAPFVTEAIWSHMSWQTTQLISAPWPESGKVNPKALAAFEELQTLITEIRTIKSELELSEVSLYHQGAELIAANAELITKLSGIKEARAVKAGRGLPLTSLGFPAWLSVERDMVKRYITTLEAKQTAQQARIKALEAQLKNRAFLKNAPKAVVKERRQSLRDEQEQLKQLETQLKRLKTA